MLDGQRDEAEAEAEAMSERRAAAAARGEALAAAAPRLAATTISTIAVHTRDSRIVLAVLQVQRVPRTTVEQSTFAPLAAHQCCSGRVAPTSAAFSGVRAGWRLGAPASRAPRAQPVRDGRERTRGARTLAPPCRTHRQAQRMRLVDLHSHSEQRFAHSHSS